MQGPPMQNPPHHVRELVMSYMILRRVVGVIGLALPVALVAGHLLIDPDPLPPSISDYYYSDMRDLLIGSMWALAVFMASYRGHERKDDITGDITCISAILVSLFPVAPAQGASESAELIGYVHLTAAGVFFISLAYFCLVLFRKGLPAVERRKRLRNRVYLTCGLVIVGCLVALILFGFMGDRWPLIAEWKLVFWVEAIGIWAFGWSWLVKGQGLLADKPAS
jgi:hypothetical protein